MITPPRKELIFTLTIFKEAEPIKHHDIFKITKNISVYQYLTIHDDIKQSKYLIPSFINQLRSPQDSVVVIVVVVVVIRIGCMEHLTHMVYSLNNLSKFLNNLRTAFYTIDLVHTKS